MKNAANLSRLVLATCLLAGSAVMLMAQGSYRAQVRGVIEDASGAVVHPWEHSREKQGFRS